MRNGNFTHTLYTGMCGAVLYTLYQPYYHFDVPVGCAKIMFFGCWNAFNIIQKLGAKL